MSRYYLLRISIEGFRGINNSNAPLDIEFDPNKVTSIFGRNGTGKSSVFEAIVYAISGDIPRLSGLQSTENPDHYYLNKFHTGQACIGIAFMADDSSDTVTITVTLNESGQRTVQSSDVSDPEAFLEQIACETLWIDFNRFNAFVLATPLDRGREFSKMLGLRKISALRAGLSALVDTRAFNSDCDRSGLSKNLTELQSSAGQARVNALMYLSKIAPHDFTQDTFDDGAIASLCVQKLSANTVVGGFFSELQLDQVDFVRCRERISEEEGGSLRTEYQKLLGIKSNLENGYDAGSIQSQLTSILAKVHVREELINQTKGTAYKDLYSAAWSIHTANPSDDYCPLCEREWANQSGLDLPTFVQTELRKFQEVISLEDEIKTAWHQVTHNQRLLEVERTIVGLTANEAAASTVQTFQRATTPSETDIVDFREVLDEIDETLGMALTELGHSCAEMQAQLPMPLVEVLDAVHNAEELMKCIKTYKSTMADIRTVQSRTDAVEEWHTFLDQVSKLCREAETELITETIRQLGDDIRQIYEEVMPYSDILPKVKRDVGSEKVFLELENFFGLRDLDAVPLLSESYRNALGLSVFLAESKRRAYGGKFIIVDDVTSSFDSGHQNFLVTAIYKHVARPVNPDGVQVILLSHDGLLEKFFDNCSNNGWEWTSMKLQGLAPTGLIHSGASYGPRVRTSLDACLYAGDVESALPLLRQYFEFKLMEIIRELHIRVPLDFAIQDDRKMIRNMINAIVDDLNIHNRLGDCCLPLTSVTMIRDTLIPSLIANYVQHYETGSTASFTSSVLRGLIGQIDDLAQACQYTCNCTRTPKRVYYRSLTQKRKSCTSRCL